MNGIVHPHALVLARSFAVSVESCQMAIIQAEGDLALAGSIIRVFVMANEWPDVARMKANAHQAIGIQRDSELARLFLPSAALVTEVLP